MRSLRKLQSDRGFTLIELLIVLIILGILVAIVIFGVTTFRNQAEKSACQTDERQVKTAAAAYLASNSTPAASVKVLVDAKLLDGEFKDGAPTDLIKPPDEPGDPAAYYISYLGSPPVIDGKLEGPPVTSC